jgi:hypothetical protein
VAGAVAGAAGFEVEVVVAGAAVVAGVAGAGVAVAGVVAVVTAVVAGAAEVAGAVAVVAAVVAGVAELTGAVAVVAGAVVAGFEVEVVAAGAVAVVAGAPNGGDDGTVAACACRENTSKTASIPAAKIATCIARRAMCRNVAWDTSSSRSVGRDRPDPSVPLRKDSLDRLSRHFGTETCPHGTYLSIRCDKGGMPVRGRRLQPAARSPPAADGPQKRKAGSRLRSRRVVRVRLGERVEDPGKCEGGQRPDGRLAIDAGSGQRGADQLP